jgi:hypothetical protein
MSGVEEEEKEPVTDLSNPQVTDKYREAAKIANFALTALISRIKPGMISMQEGENSLVAVYMCPCGLDT